MASEQLEKAAEEVVYTALGHSGLETSRIPLNPNSLAFSDKATDEKFTLKILGEKSDSKLMSLTLKNNLVLFYTVLVFFALIALVSVTVLTFRMEIIEKNAFVVHISALIGLVLIGFFVLLLVIRSLRFRLHMRNLYLPFMLLLMTYLILCDQRILPKLLQSTDELSQDRLNYPLVILVFLYLYSLISFSHYIGTLVVCVYTLVLYIGCALYASPQHTLVTVADFLFLVIFCALLCFRTHQTEFRARHLFWRMEKEERATEVKLDVTDHRRNSGHTLNTEVERLIELCESIKKKIKAAASVVIFKDIKTDLKIALVEIEKVRREVVKGNFNGIVGFDKDMDADDKEFIYQQFYHRTSLSRPSTTQHLTFADRKATVMNLMDYGVEELNGVLAGIGNNWNFDIWFVHQTTGHSISLMAKYLIKKWEFATVLGVPESLSDEFFRAMEKGYYKNPYHNACHGADVCHSFLYFIETSGLLNKLTPIELGASIIACLGHDLGHLGLTNRFLINNKDKIALRYNDMSVLENMHVSRIYKLLRTPEQDILKNLPSEDWIQARKIIIEMVLHTDMSKHFETLGLFRARTQSSSDIDLVKTDDKVFVLAMGLKCADLGHSAKNAELHQKWTEMVCEEFFNQGDLEKEKGQPVSMYCDRETTDVSKSQAGFLKNICIPLFEAWLEYLNCPDASRDCLSQLKMNLAMWELKSRARKGTEVPLFPRQFRDSGKETNRFCNNNAADVPHMPPMLDELAEAQNKVVQ